MVRFPNGAAFVYTALRPTIACAALITMDSWLMNMATSIHARGPRFSDRHWPTAMAGRSSSARPKVETISTSIHKEAQNNPAWYSLVLRASHSGLLPQHELDDMRRMLTADQYDQELECSFDAAIRGAIYRTELAADGC